MASNLIFVIPTPKEHAGLREQLRFRGFESASIEDWLTAASSPAGECTGVVIVTHADDDYAKASIAAFMWQYGLRGCMAVDKESEVCYLLYPLNRYKLQLARVRRR